ncbi:hypothetical protein RRG08_027775 [Elysia crispata]|uniref:Uncharacterized protein n=1 Tax=Elysia crispata TaxID=231223 RepID=A0AAE1DC06_9GAST|nr:hypothetical protein RRG08_027775 [Elysia crispata]
MISKRQCCQLYQNIVQPWHQLRPYLQGSVSSSSTTLHSWGWRQVDSESMLRGWGGWKVDLESSCVGQSGSLYMKLVLGSLYSDAASDIFPIGEDNCVMISLGPGPSRMPGQRRARHSSSDRKTPQRLLYELDLDLASPQGTPV